LQSVPAKKARFSKHNQSQQDNQSTFNDLPDMNDQILQRVKEVTQVPMVVIGNKCDLNDERIITTEQGDEMAKKFGARFLEASAKTKINVENIFIDLVKQISTTLPKEKKKKSRGCQLL